MLDRIAVPTLPGSGPRSGEALAGRPPSRRAEPTPILRRVPGGVAASLDALPDGALPRLDFAGTAAALRPRLRAAVAERLPRPRWLANWLVDDALGLVAALAGLSGPAPLRVAFGAGDAALAEGASLRLVASYRGPAIAWRGGLLAPGEVVLLRGGPTRLLRRASRPGEGAPLCLVVDVPDGGRQPPNSRVSTPSQSRST